MMRRSAAKRSSAALAASGSGRARAREATDAQSSGLSARSAAGKNSCSSLVICRRSASTKRRMTWVTASRRTSASCRSASIAATNVRGQLLQIAMLVLEIADRCRGRRVARLERMPDQVLLRVVDQLGIVGEIFGRARPARRSQARPPRPGSATCASKVSSKVAIVLCSRRRSSISKVMTTPPD